MRRRAPAETLNVALPAATLSETFAEKVTVVGAEAGMNFVVWLKLGGVRAASQAGGEPGPTDLRGGGGGSDLSKLSDDWSRRHSHGYALRGPSPPSVS